MKKIILLICMLLAWNSCACALTRDEIRAAYNALNILADESPYQTEPTVVSPYSEGKLTDAALEAALNELNFIRYLAGLNAVSLNELYTLECQCGAMLMAADDEVDHDAAKPDDMNKDLYDTAHLGTIHANIAKFNWMRPDILRDAVRYFTRDDGENNLANLGHRRWVLNPSMSETGFGLANSASGLSYVSMYAHDTEASCDWQTVCWPAAGAFPAELMHTNLAWSISFNDEYYTLDASKLRVTLAEESSGLTFHFSPTADSDGFCALSDDDYGSGACLIFRPDFSETDFTDYQQNQIWTVTVDGLNETLTFTVQMVSLYPQDVAAVELSDIEATLQIGEEILLCADIIPSYADDLSVTWTSSDPFIATVNKNGLVRAISEGECVITAKSSNGRTDCCNVKVLNSN